MPRAPRRPLFSSGSNGPVPSDGVTRWDPASGSPSSLVAPPHHALSHHPVTEALLTAASHLGEKGSH